MVKIMLVLGCVHTCLAEWDFLCSSAAGYRFSKFPCCFFSSSRMSPSLVVFVHFPAPGWRGKHRLMPWAAAQRLRGLRKRGCEAV